MYMAGNRLQSSSTNYLNHNLKMSISVTVCTPAYNRASLLDRLYQSLCRQTCKDFEWLVVDDGSTDETLKLLQKFKEDKKIPVRYFSKPNGGKHTAVNLGVKEAKGGLFFIADSDDYLPEDSIEVVLSFGREIIEASKNGQSKDWGGVCGLDGLENGQIVGTGLPFEQLDTTVIEIRDKYAVQGDMKEVYLTSVMREFPFPEIPGERFCPEALIWNRIATKYKLRFFNRVIYIADYQSDGITSGITRVRMKSPVATMMTYAEWFDQNISFKKKIRMAINYWRFAFCAKNRSVRISSWGNLLLPLGLLMHLNDKRKIKL